MGGLLAVAAYFTPFSILRALGDSKTPLIFLVVCSLLNIALDLLFVVGLNTGVAGAVIATVLSEALAAAACIIYAFKKVPQFRQAFQYRAINKGLIQKTLRVGVPTGLQYALIYVSSIILQRIVNDFGESVIGAFTATTQIELLVQEIFSVLGAAIMTYTGQNIGAGKHERVLLGVTAAMKISAVVSVIVLIVFWLFSRPIMSIFVTNTEIISIAANGIRITSLFLMGLGGVQILRYMLNGAGGLYVCPDERYCGGDCAGSLCHWPDSDSSHWDVGLTTGLTWTATALFALVRYKHGAWMSKKLVRAVRVPLRQKEADTSYRARIRFLFCGPAGQRISAIQECHYQYAALL